MTTSRESKIARSFAALASGDAVARVVAFLAGVYIARTLGASMFGVMAFGQAVVLYFTHLAACGVDLTGIREVAEEPGRAHTLAPSILSFRTLVSVGLIAVLATGALVFLPSLDGVVVACYALTLLGHGPNPKFVLMGLSRPGPVAWSRTIGELVYVTLVLLFVRTQVDIVHVPLAQALGDVLAVALMLLALKRAGFAMQLELDWPAIKPLMTRSFPLVLNILLGLMIFNSDLLVLRWFRDTTTVGWYSASYQLISFLINMAWAYSYSLLPALSQADAASGERSRLYQTSLAQSFAVGLPIAVGGALLSSTMIALVFGAEYQPSGVPLAILLASIPLMLQKDVAMVALIVARRERAVLGMTAIAVAFNLALNMLVIPRYGMIGAACTTLATEALRAVLALWLARRDGFAPLGVARQWKASLSCLAMALALHWAAEASMWITLPIGVAVYSTAMIALGGLRLRRGMLPVLSV